MRALIAFVSTMKCHDSKNKRLVQSSNFSSSKAALQIHVCEQCDGRGEAKNARAYRSKCRELNASE